MDNSAHSFTEGYELSDKDNAIQSSIRQEIELYERIGIPYPNPTTLIEVVSNYQHLINHLQFRMFELLNKNDKVIIKRFNYS